MNKAFKHVTVFEGFLILRMSFLKKPFMRSIFAALAFQDISK